MSTISIRPATITDAKDISDIHYAALNRYHECYAAFFKTHPRDLLPLMTEKALRNPKMTFLVAVDDATEKIVGFVRYNIENGSEDKAEEPKTSEDPTKPAPATQFARKEHLEELWKKLSGPREDAMDACHEKAAEGKKHYYIVHLMIDPAHQRRGIGNKLLSRVLQKADEEGLPASLTSSVESHGLYLKLGFVDVEEFNIDNGDWMRQVRECEIQNGLPPSDELVEMYDGVTETEHVMVRRARPLQ